MGKTSINQIISARLLLQKARIQSTKTGIEKTFAILYAHDSLDWILQYLHDDITTSKNNKRMFMVDYAGVIAKNSDKFGSFDESKCNQLNTMLNIALWCLTISKLKKSYYGWESKLTP